jgi:hypothetical protein
MEEEKPGQPKRINDPQFFMEPGLCLGIERFPVTARSIATIKCGIAYFSQLADCVSVTFPRVAVAKVFR